MKNCYLNLLKLLFENLSIVLKLKLKLPYFVEIELILSKDIENGKKTNDDNEEKKESFCDMLF